MNAFLFTVCVYEYFVLFFFLSFSSLACSLLTLSVCPACFAVLRARLPVFLAC